MVTPDATSIVVGDAIVYAMHYSRSADSVIRVYDAAGNVIETHEHKGDQRQSHGKHCHR
jgi:hypothetical protein